MFFNILKLRSDNSYKEEHSEYSDNSRQILSSEISIFNECFTQHI